VSTTDFLSRPLRVAIDDSDTPGIFVSVADDEDKGFLCEMDMGEMSEENVHRAEAYATFFAAAPLMLRALECVEEIARLKEMRVSDPEYRLIVERWLPDLKRLFPDLSANYAAGTSQTRMLLCGVTAILCEEALAAARGEAQS
jgi:hypothetical protein